MYSYNIHHILAYHCQVLHSTYLSFLPTVSVNIKCLNICPGPCSLNKIVCVLVHTVALRSSYPSSKILGNTELFVYLYFLWSRYWGNALDVPSGACRCTEQWRNKIFWMSVYWNFTNYLPQTSYPQHYRHFIVQKSLYLWTTVLKFKHLFAQWLFKELPHVLGNKDSLVV